VVVAGVTVTGVPLTTAPMPLLIVPVPPEKTAFRVVEFPAVIVLAPAVKLLIAAAGTTVTVAVADTEPALLVTVNV
jgi:hypothetical protein